MSASNRIDGHRRGSAYLSISIGSFANAVASEGIPKHYFTELKPKFSRQELDPYSK